MLKDALEGIIFLSMIGFLTNMIALRLGFFTRPDYPRPRVSFIQLISVFAIYFGFLLLAPFLLSRFLSGTPMTIQFIIILCMSVSLLLYIYTEGRGTLTAAVKHPKSTSSRWLDFAIGIFAWLVAFPWVVIVSQICDYLLENFLNFKAYEQVAVRYLKDNLVAAPQLILALISIVIIAPVVEELLFRGALQQFLKKYFSIKISIAITALIFACFHFSASQGLGNLSLIPSLFTFACFLGYTYERQGSIFASIGLHMTFNLASSLQIIFS